MTANWARDPASHFDFPEFILLDEAFSCDLEGSNYDLAIADASSYEKRMHKEKEKEEKGHSKKSHTLKQSLGATGKPAIVIQSDPALDFYKLEGAVLEL